MSCPKCGSEKTEIKLVVKKKRNGIIKSLLLILFTGGLYLIWLLIRGRKEQTYSYMICNNCGYQKLVHKE